MSVVPLPPRGEWFGDAREPARALRASWHTGPDEAPYVVLSTWRGDACVATARLSATEAAGLVSVLARGLAAATAPVTSAPVTSAPGDVQSA